MSESSSAMYVWRCVYICITQQLQALADVLEDQIGIPAPTWHLATLYNFSSGVLF